jgi:uncharacterized protein YcfJ
MAFVRHGVVGMWAALLLSITGVAWAATNLQVEAFDVEQVPQLAAGARLNFSVFGSPGATATLQIDGAPYPLELRETQPGVYEGSYTIGERDHIAPDGRVVATLRRGEQAATMELTEPLQLGASPPVAAAPPPALPQALPDRRACDDCAVVESIRAVEIRGVPGHLGAIVGGVIGALFGDQIGQAEGRRVARIVGAVGGALAGREIERRHGSRTQYDVVLRRPDGTTQMRRYEGMPPFRVGDTIRLRPGVH